MGLFKRVSDNIRANINSLLDKAEDPEKLLDQYLRDMEEDVADAESAVARQLAIARKFKNQLDDTEAMVKKRESQAVEALKKDREDLARKALEDKKINQAKAQDYRKQYESCETMAEQLRKIFMDEGK
jgi:phage shock protein A